MRRIKRNWKKQIRICTFRIRKLSGKGYCVTALMPMNIRHEPRSNDNERLEFLGDAVLELVPAVSICFMQLSNDMPEGDADKAACQPGMRADTGISVPERLTCWEDICCLGKGRRDAPADRHRAFDHV